MARKDAQLFENLPKNPRSERISRHVAHASSFWSRQRAEFSAKYLCVLEQSYYSSIICLLLFQSPVWARFSPTFFFMRVDFLIAAKSEWIFNRKFWSWFRNRWKTYMWPSPVYLKLSSMLVLSKQRSWTKLGQNEASTGDRGRWHLP